QFFMLTILLLASFIAPSYGGGFQQHAERGPVGGGSKPSHGAGRLGGNNNNIGRGGNRHF
ncbi:hypothetical protein P7A73_14745, partial [Clostridium perfringens]|nr:hypothetical protein [Clostridium perfringens]